MPALPFSSPRALPEPYIPRAWIYALLYASSPEDYRRTLEEPPELQPFDAVMVPLHEALGGLLIAYREETIRPEKVVIVQEIQPGIAAVIAINSQGERIAHLYNVDAQVIADLLLVTPEPLHLLVCDTLQVATSYPGYLTLESYWCLQEILNSPNVSKSLLARLEAFYQALQICLQHGLDQEWMLSQIGIDE